MNPRVLSPFFLPLLLLLIPTPTNRIEGCGAPAPPGRHVKITDESAIIIWDAATKTQHFIRRASFTTDAPNFGFLVPTPEHPDVQDVDEKVFTFLEDLTAPKVIHEYRVYRDKKGGAPASSAGVRVLEEKRIEGFDVAILEADSADALAEWLKKRNFAFTDSLKDWLKEYIAKRWKVTAFKFIPEPGKPVLSSAVRMSFKTSTPFFPYREPEDQRLGAGQDRVLRIYFLAEQRMEGKLGNGTTVWPGEVAWANRIAETNRRRIAQMLNLANQFPPGKWFLTEFEDKSSPRPGIDEVYFSVSADQSTAERPPVTHYHSRAPYWYENIEVVVGVIIAVIVVVVVVVAVAIVRRLRRK